MESDVKAIRARFQATQAASPQTDSTGSPSHPGRLKTPLHPTLSSGSSSTSPFLLPKKPSLDGPSSGPLLPKPAFPKPSSSSSCKGAPRGGQETAKALASRFSMPQEEHSGSSSSSKPFPRGNTEPTPPKPKLPVQKPPGSAPLPESRPAFHKPPPVMPTATKPSWISSSAGGTETNHGSPTSKPPPTLQKPSSAVTKLWVHGEGAKAESESNAPVSRLPAGFSIAPFGGPGAMEKEKTKPYSTPPPKPLVNKKPRSFIRRNLDSHPAPQQNVGDPDGAPRMNPLANPLLIGPPPAKPSRPPQVNLDRFRGQAKAPDQGPVIVPPPPASNPRKQSDGGVTPPLSAQPMAPSLPPRHPGISEPDPEEYDDVVVTAPPPPPSTEGRPRLMSKLQEEGSDGETYEELDERWEAADLREQELKEKQKEEKKRLEAEKKDQKEREKKENEARKKFKLVGPLEKMHQVKVLVECKGSKTDLALKKGDCVDIIRVQDNPEGKWLGRLANGSIGYLKNDCVEVDLQSWKQQQGPQPPQPIDDQEVYDDVDLSNNHPDSGIKGSRVILPPPPDDAEEIYDDAIDASLDVRVPPPSQFTAKGQPGALIDDEIYDDIDSQVVPPPLPVSSHPPPKTKMEEIDPKRQKKLEKEEKEFRKKFKYEGEIQVLYQVTIIPTLTLKKLSGKDLPVKPGEKLDVIVKAVDNKLVCRNEEGKFGTVLTSHIVTDDGDIYDDIGDECIYDND